jgi:hypothetical protein
MSGHISSNFFTNWLQDFHMHKSSVPIFLLQDGKASYVNNEEAPSFAGANSLQFLCLPFHITYFLQPPCKSLFWSSNSDFNKASGTWMKNGPARGLTKLIIGNLERAMEACIQSML